VPIYEYRCPNGDVFELFQRMDEPPPQKCPICGEGPLEKVLYPVAVHFKGSGFYSTDYGRSRKTAKEGDAGGDSKPAAKPAEKSKSETTKASD
jgi:putative FmdB family regulatory protein